MSGGGASSFGDQPFRLSRHNDRVVRIDWADGVEIGDEDAATAIGALKEFTGRTSSPVLVDVRTMRSVSRDARKQFAQDHGASRVAILVGSALSKTVADFFIGLSDPEVPIRVFDDEVAAIAWLSIDGA